MINTYLLEYFITFYEEGSLLKASEKLHVSQPSLTRAMQKLEDELDLTIFTRSGNKISLNENGKILLDYIKDIIALNNLLTKKAKELKENDLLIHIAMTAPGILYYYPYFFFNNFGKYTNKICDAGTCIKEVKEGLIDLAFINENIDDEGIISEKVVDEKLYVCLPKEHFLAKKEFTTYEELDGQSFLLANELGVWDNIVKRRLPKSTFFRLDRNNVAEVAKYSSIPSFQTDISMKLENRGDKINISVIGDETIVPFYAIYRPSKKKIFNFIKLAR